MSCHKSLHWLSSLGFSLLPFPINSLLGTMMNSNVGRGPKLAKHTDADSLSQKGPVADDENGLPHAEQKKVMRRVDLRLLMTCGLMYSISLMDRSNIAFAAVAGMIRDLNLIGYRYVR